MKTKTKITIIALATAAGISTALAQTLVWSDNFDDNDPTGWTPSYYGQVSETNQQFIASGSFGPTPPANPVVTYAYGYHPIPTSGPLPDNQTLEARVDVVGANQNDAFAHLQFLWYEGATTHAYTLYKDQDEIGLMKSWNGGGSLAFFFATNQPIKNQNVTLILALTRRDSNVEINTRVLDRDNGDAVLFNQTTTDTPESDPVLLSSPAPDKDLVVVPDLAGTPWPVISAPDSVLLGMAWVDTQHGSTGDASVTFDNLQVWQYEVPPLGIQNAVVLSWSFSQGQGQFEVVTAPAVGGPWEPLADPWCRTNATQVQVSVPAAESARFFRLRFAP